MITEIAMGAAEKIDFVSVEEYLGSESDSPVKREYVDGYMHAMAGAGTAHNRIAGNAHGVLFARLKGSPCLPWGSDMLIRVHTPGRDRFYYPDLSVVCQHNPQGDGYQDKPVVVLEVLSKSTRRTDLGEKRNAYLSLPSLKAYIVAEQSVAQVRVWRKLDTGIKREEYQGLDAVVPLPEIGTQIDLAEIYAGVEFGPEPENVR